MIKAQLVIGLPFCGRGLAPRWAVSMLQQEFPVSLTADYHAVGGMSVTAARNEIAQEAISAEAAYLWFVDDDVASPSGALRKLMYTLKQGEHDRVAAVGGIYCTKTSVPEPLVFKSQGAGSYWKWKVGDIFDVDGMGLGCFLINLTILKQLPQPWFRDVDENGVQQSEDLYFCEQVRRAGFRILAHGGVLCTHWKQDPEGFRSYTLPTDSYPYK